MSHQPRNDAEGKHDNTCESNTETSIHGLHRNIKSFPEWYIKLMGQPDALADASNCFVRVPRPRCKELRGSSPAARRVDLHPLGRLEALEDLHSSQDPGAQKTFLFYHHPTSYTTVLRNSRSAGGFRNQSFLPKSKEFTSSCDAMNSRKLETPTASTW